MNPPTNGPPELGTAARAQELSSILLAKDADGGYQVDDRAAKAAIALISLGLARADHELELSRFVMGLIGDFTLEAGLSADSDPATLAPKLEAFLLETLPADLRAQLELFFREEITGGGKGVSKQLAQQLGLSKKAGPLDSGARPAGTIAAGPMARFQIDTTKK